MDIWAIYCCNKLNKRWVCVIKQARIVRNGFFYKKKIVFIIEKKNVLKKICIFVTLSSLSQQFNELLNTRVCKGNHRL